MGVITKIAGKLLNLVDRKDAIRGLRDSYVRDGWLRRVNNIVHVGANTGQDAHKYAERGLGVLWIEPIPSVFSELKIHIASHPTQMARQALLADVAGKKFTLNIAVNGGASSSIFDLAEHKDIWPDVGYADSIDLVSETLDDILLSHSAQYDGLVIDTQGAELLVLKGSTVSIPRFKFIKSEAADFELYKGAAKEMDLIEFLKPMGFRVARRDVFARKPDGCGECSDLLFERDLR